MIILKKDKNNNNKTNKKASQKKAADFGGQCVVGFQTEGFLMSWFELDSEEM